MDTLRKLELDNAIYSVLFQIRESKEEADYIIARFKELSDKVIAEYQERMDGIQRNINLADNMSAQRTIITEHKDKFTGNFSCGEIGGKFKVDENGYLCYDGIVKRGSDSDA